MRIGQFLSLGVLSLFLAGCATVATHQAECEKKYSNFQDMVRCLKTQTSQDTRINNAIDNDLTKLYLLQAENMSSQVGQGQISESDARLKLATDYSQLKGVALARKSQTQRDNAASLSALGSYMQATQPQPTYFPQTTYQAPKITNCHRVGNSVMCTTY